MASSDVTPWLPARCCFCGERIRVSKDTFGCSYVGTGWIGNPIPMAWHWECQHARLPGGEHHRVEDGTPEGAET